MNRLRICRAGAAATIAILVASVISPAAATEPDPDWATTVGTSGEVRRLAGEPAGNPAHGFSDVPEGSFFAEAVRWPKAQVITTGTSPTTYAPEDVVTRGQMAAFLLRMATDSDWVYPG